MIAWRGNTSHLTFSLVQVVDHLVVLSYKFKKEIIQRGDHNCQWVEHYSLKSMYHAQIITISNIFHIDFHVERKGRRNCRFLGKPKCTVMVPFDLQVGTSEILCFTFCYIELMKYRKQLKISIHEKKRKKIHYQSSKSESTPYSASTPHVGEVDARIEADYTFPSL